MLYRRVRQDFRTPVFELRWGQKVGAVKAVWAAEPDNLFSRPAAPIGRRAGHAM
jgi:hypothetical protein